MPRQIRPRQQNAHMGEGGMETVSAGSYGDVKGLTNEEKATYIFRNLQAKADTKNSLMGWFRQWDTEKKGWLTREDCRLGINNFHFEASDDVIEMVVNRFDLDRNSCISFHEFASCLRPTGGVDMSAVKWNDKKPVRSVVDQTNSRIWKKLPEDKDTLVRYLETFDEDGTGLMGKSDFRKTLLSLRVIKPLEVDTVIDSDIYSAGRLFNYRLWLQEASRVGCQEESIDAGRSPRMRVPYTGLRDTIRLDKERILHDNVEAMLSPRYHVTGRNDFSLHVNPFTFGKGIKETILDKQPGSLQYAPEQERLALKTDPCEYLPSMEERIAKRERRDRGVHQRIENNETRVINSVIAEQYHKEENHQQKLGQFRKQRDWYADNVAIQARMNRDVQDQSIRVNRDKGPPHFGYHTSGGFSQTMF